MNAISMRPRSQPVSWRTVGLLLFILLAYVGIRHWLDRRELDPTRFEEPFPIKPGDILYVGAGDPAVNYHLPKWDGGRPILATYAQDAVLPVEGTRNSDPNSLGQMLRQGTCIVLPGYSKIKVLQAGDEYGVCQVEWQGQQLWMLDTFLWRRR